MGIARHGLLVGSLLLLGGCGSAPFFESEQQRQARIDAAVQQALVRERALENAQAPLMPSPAPASGLEGRLAGLERMTTAISDRLELLEQTEAATLDGRSSRDAEIDGVRRDVVALSAAVDRLSVGDSDSEAVLRARLERLELRTSRIAWPKASSAVRAVHLASYRTHQAALAGWEVLAARYPNVLAQETPTLVEVRTVAGEYVRLFAGMGLDGEGLLRIREALRDGGDYAMILPLPGNAGS